MDAMASLVMDLLVAIGGMVVMLPLPMPGASAAEMVKALEIDGRHDDAEALALAVAFS